MWRAFSIVPMPSPEPVSEPAPLPLLLPLLELDAAGARGARAGTDGTLNRPRGDVGSVGILNGAAVGLRPPSRMLVLPLCWCRARGGDDKPRDEKDCGPS